MIYLIVIPWARVVCLIYTPEARGPQHYIIHIHLYYALLVLTQLIVTYNYAKILTDGRTLICTC